ncbi:MAG TPA: Ig-like domain-containing protein [Vicinamibacteria bacterium]|nr:Ig-like domain-containing protein [Vicinamibacteria bacterium]
MRRCLLLLLAAVIVPAATRSDDTLVATKDSFLTQGSPNQNEGANHILRLQASGNNRVLLGFDVAGKLEGLQEARLVLTISDISTNWSASGRPVRVHRLLDTFAEGNGWNVGNNVQGTGAGVTWKCSKDTDIANAAADCAMAWDGGSFVEATAPAVLHFNGMTGEVVFDVTADVLALGAGAAEAVFLVKKENEGDAGKVEYFSVEAAAASGDPSLGPRLVLVSANPNLPPTVVDDTAITARNRTVVIDVLANDSDGNNDSITLVSVTDPPNGDATVENGLVRYTPDTDFIGTDDFSYTVEDTSQAQSTGTVAVTIGRESQTTLQVTKDAFLRQGAPDTSEGASTMLRVRQSGKNRALVQFDLSEPDLSGLLTAELVLTVQNAGENWGEGRMVRAHRLLSDWTEGNGFNANGNERGAGPGVTWACATDEDVSDQSPGCLIQWDGGDYAPSSGPGFLHTQGMTGEVTFDVTDDVKEGAPFGWLVKKDDEGQSGLVEYHSKESDPALAPRLVLERIDLGNLAPVAVDDFAQTSSETEIIIDVLGNDSYPDGDSLSITNVTNPPNGAATLQADQSITYLADAGFTGTDFFDYTISDGFETATATVTVTVTALDDTTPPTITAMVEPAPNADGWHNSNVTVTFDCQDAESGIQSCTEAVIVAAEGKDQLVTGEAFDHAGNFVSTTITLSLDKTPPSVSLSAPSTGRRGQTISVASSASDNLALNSVTIAVAGVEVATLSEEPFETTVTVPPNATVGSFISVVATANDLAGNTASSPPASFEVLGGGFVTGEVYDDTRGLPLAGATVSTETTNAMGRFGLSTNEASVTLRAERAGFTVVERVVVVDQVSGTVVPDMRLTPLDDNVTSLGASGGIVTSARGNFSLTVPSGVLSSDKDFRLTSVSGRGLRNVLPLGWSPIGSVQVEPAALSLPSATIALDAAGLTGLSIALIRYDEVSSVWVVEANDLSGDESVTATIGETGTYSFVVADTAATLPPQPTVGEPLLGVAPREVSFGLSASSEVTPAISPVSPEAMAQGSVVLFSPLALPSGTLVSARVEETVESFSEGSLIREPFSQEMPLYRFPLREDEELHLDFPVAPSRKFTVDELKEGRIHVEIELAPAFYRGVLVGEEGAVVMGAGGAELIVPSGALTNGTVSVSVEARDPLTVAIGFEGMTLVASAEVELSGAILEVPGTLSLPANLASPSGLFIAKLLFVSGQRKVRLIGPASLADGRIRADIGSGGTYLFFQASEPLGLVQGTVTEGGSPAGLVVVESSTSPFADVTPASGFFTVGARLEPTTITARSLVTGNQAVSIVTPSSATSTVNLDLALTLTGPFVTDATPLDGAVGVSLSPSIRLTFSEPVDPTTISTSSISVRRADQTPVSGRAVLGVGNLSVSFLPDDNLEPLTNYIVVATSAVQDMTSNSLLPFASSFTTLDDSIAERNPDALTVSFPDADGFVTIAAPAFSFEPGSSVTTVNLTNGVVVTGNVDTDGSLFFAILASITDELQIRILDSSNHEIVIHKTEFHGPNGEVAIGRRGGKISLGDFELAVPDGALAGAAIFTLTEVEQTVLDELPLADGAGGFGSGVEVNMGGAALGEEADLRLPIPPLAPPDADFVIVRKVEEQGEVLYEIIDTATVAGGKLKTESPPFPGISSGGFYFCIWYPTVPSTGRNPLGAITGIAREIDTSAVNPLEIPLSGVTVRVDEALQGGQYTATTNDEGRFVLFDALFGTVGSLVNLLARDGKGRESRSVAFEDPDVVERFGTLSRFTRAGDVVFDFPLSPPEPPRTTLTVLLFEQDGAIRTAITNGFVTVGDELVIKLQFTQPPGDGTVFVDVSGQSIPMMKRPDELVSGGGQAQPLFVYEGTFRPQQARAYTIVAEGRDAFTNLLTQRKSFLAVPAGAGNDVPLDGAPAVISDSAVPRDGEEGVPVSQVISVQFTEPVTNVNESTVTLTELSNNALAISVDLVATKRDGTVGPPGPADEAVALTITPTQGLKFSQSYRVLFSTAIVDLPSPGQPSPLPLDDATNQIVFETFAPKKIGDAPLDATLVALATLDHYALVATQPKGADGTTGNLHVFDLADPSQPTLVGDPSVFVGSMVRDISVEENVDMQNGILDVAAVLSFNPRSGNSGLTMFDVTSRQSPFPYAGFVTTVVPGEGSDYQVDLHEGFAYVATAWGGLKIVNLREAKRLFGDELLLTSTAVGFGSIPFPVSQGLFSRGIGFGRQAIQNRINIPDPAGGTDNLSVTTVKVVGTGQDRVGYVGGISLADGVGRLTTVNLQNAPAASVYATTALATEPDPVDGSTIHMSQPSDTAVTHVGAQKIAVLAGGPMVKNGPGTLAIVDVTNPVEPDLLTVIELEGGWATSLAIDEDSSTVFVSTAGRDTGEFDNNANPIMIPAQVEIYNLTNPANPELAGVMRGTGGEIGVVSQILLTTGSDIGLDVHLISAAINDFTDDLDQPSAEGRAHPEDPNDLVFVTDFVSDNECRFKTSGPIEFDVGIKRYVGQIDENDGNLVDAAQLIANGFVSQHAILTIAAFDVDSGVRENPEIDRVLINGVEVGHLTGRKNKWTKSSLLVPIEILRFPERAQPGSSPTPVMNNVRIEIDVGSPPAEARWCTAVDWASIRFKTVSPIIFVHGNGSDGDFYRRQGFAEYLELVGFPFDNSISLVPKANFVHINSEKLNVLIPDLVHSFGVDSVHLVVHSKGGLDTRDYLARFQPQHDDDFRVLSVTSLSTPHNGSVGADILLLNERASIEAAKTEFVAFPSLTNLAALVLGVENGKRNLTTGFAATFNARNLPLLSQDVVFNVVAADADVDGSSAVDTVAEIRGVPLEDPSIARVLSVSPATAAFVVDRAYQLLRGTQTIQYVLGSKQILQGTPNEQTISVAKLMNIPPKSPSHNDTLVTIASGLGQGTLEPRVENLLELRGEDTLGTGGEGRNHASVADGAVASRVLPWIIKVETTKGDLK